MVKYLTDHFMGFPTSEEQNILPKHYKQQTYGWMCITVLFLLCVWILGVHLSKRSRFSTVQLKKQSCFR